MSWQGCLQWFVSAKNQQQPEEEKLVNYEMVKAGLAHHYRQYSQGCPNGSDALEKAEQQAREQRLGVWGLANPVKPWDYRKQR